MSSEVKISRDKLRAVLDEFRETHPPRNSDGELELERIYAMIENQVEISATELVKHLARAGYLDDEILYFLYRAGIISSLEDLVVNRYREKINVALLSEEE